MNAQDLLRLAAAALEVMRLAERHAGTEEEWRAINRVATDFCRELRELEDDATRNDATQGAAALWQANFRAVLERSCAAVEPLVKARHRLPTE